MAALVLSPCSSFAARRASAQSCRVGSQGGRGGRGRGAAALPQAHSRGALVEEESGKVGGRWGAGGKERERVSDLRITAGPYELLALGAGEVTADVRGFSRRCFPTARRSSTSVGAVRVAGSRLGLRPRCRPRMRRAFLRPGRSCSTPAGTGDGDPVPLLGHYLREQAGSARRQPLPLCGRRPGKLACPGRADAGRVPRTSSSSA